MDALFFLIFFYSWLEIQEKFNVMNLSRNMHSVKSKIFAKLCEYVFGGKLALFSLA